MYALVIITLCVIVMVIGLLAEFRAVIVNRKSEKKAEAEHEANVAAWREGLEKGELPEVTRDDRIVTGLERSYYGRRGYREVLSPRRPQDPPRKPVVRKIDTQGAGYGVAIVAGLIGLVFFIFCSMVPHSNQQGDINDVLELSAKYDLDVQRRDELVAEVRAQLLQAYPQLEQEIIAGVGDPEILLSFPQIRSSETFRAAIEDIIELNDKVYSTRRSIIDNEADILGRERSPWVLRPPWFPTYDDYYDQDNPLTGQSNTSATVDPQVTTPTTTPEEG